MALNALFTALGIDPEEITASVNGLFEYMKQLAEMQKENNDMLREVKEMLENG